MNKLKLKTKSFKLVSNGYIYSNAKKWIQLTNIEKKNLKGINKQLLKKAHTSGFLYQSMLNNNLNFEDLQNYVSQKDYLYLMPINQIYQKWLNNVITLYTINKPFRKNMLKYYFHITNRDGKKFIIPLTEGINSFEYEDISDLLKKETGLNIIDLKGNIVHRLRFKNKHYYINDEKSTFQNIINEIEKMPGESVIVESEESKLLGKEIHTIMLYVSNENGDNPRILDANCTKEDITYKINILKGSYLDNNEIKIECWNNIVKTIEKMSNYFSQIEYMGILIKYNNNNFYIQSILNRPSYFNKTIPSQSLTNYLKKKKNHKITEYTTEKTKTRRNGIIKRFIRKKVAVLFYPKGLLPYLSYTWITDIFNDFFTQKEMSIKEKLYAYKNGFLSYRIKQYNITEKTRKNYISDFEYKWLRHINSTYRIWLEDKNTIKYIVSEHKEAFPDYYYLITHKNNVTQIIGLNDCPKKGPLVFDDIINLLKEKKILAFKPEEGTHGNGFYRAEYIDNKFYMNFKEVTYKEIISILNSNENSYIITEYIQMHDQLKSIYNGSVNTLRILVFKKDGRTPEIGNVYMRIGTSDTGVIDNMSAGGMFAQVDVDTGKYSNAKLFKNGNIVDCPRHPDTGVLIEGTLPNWENSKKMVIDIAKELKQLEFFGFDVAITQNGIKIPEINRSPDFPKIEKYTKKTNDYLLYKLRMKKEIYGYNNKCKTLIRLPKRN